MGREDRVETFEVSFDDSIVYVTFVEGETMSDQQLARIIRRSGYDSRGRDPELSARMTRALSRYGCPMTLVSSHAAEDARSAPGRASFTPGVPTVPQGIDPENFEPGAEIYPSVTLRGASLQVGAGSKLGKAGGGYFEDVQVGRGCDLYGGYFKGLYAARRRHDPRSRRGARGDAARGALRGGASRRLQDDGAAALRGRGQPDQLLRRADGRRHEPQGSRRDRQHPGALQLHAVGR